MLDFNIFNVFEKRVTSLKLKDLQNTHVLKKKDHFDKGKLQYAQCIVKRGHFNKAKILTQYSCFENAGSHLIQSFEKGVTSFKPNDFQNSQVLKKKGHFEIGGLQYAQYFKL